MMELSEIIGLFKEVWNNIATTRDPDLRTVADVHMDEHTTLPTGPPVSEPGGDLLLWKDDLARGLMVDEQLRIAGPGVHILGDSYRPQRCKVCGLFSEVHYTPEDIL